jgi:HK97 family phage prohead protease
MPPNTPQREIRIVPMDWCEIRDESDGPDGPRIVGHAAVFHRLSEPIWGMFVEQVAPGTFARAIRERQDVRALVDHDPKYLLGRTKSGTLTLSEDDVGLLAEIRPPDTQAARDVMTSIKRGDIDQMSFSFAARKDLWEAEAGPDGMDLRTLLDVDLYDVSAVTYPAYPDTDLAVRCHQAWKQRIQSSRGDPRMMKIRAELAMRS